MVWSWELADLSLAVRFLRALRGWNQTELARVAGWDKSRISLMESGKSKIEKADLQWLSKAAGLPFSLLIAGLPLLRLLRLAPTSQVPLVNDLRLTVEMVGANVYWRGNNFNENIDGIDNGYSYPYAVGGAPLINDTMNNVETVFIPANMFWPGQKIIIRVTGADVHSSSQKFSLYAYNVRLNS